MNMRIIKTLGRVFGRALVVYGFTAVLVAIFVIQNYLFNYWLKITPGEYALRRIASTMAIGALCSVSGTAVAAT